MSKFKLNLLEFWKRNLILPKTLPMIHEIHDNSEADCSVDK